MTTFEVFGVWGCSDGWKQVRWLGRFVWDGVGSAVYVHTTRLQVVFVHDVDGVAAVVESELCWLAMFHLYLVQKRVRHVTLAGCPFLHDCFPPLSE